MFFMLIITIKANSFVTDCLCVFSRPFFGHDAVMFIKVIFSMSARKNYHNLLLYGIYYTSSEIARQV